MLLPYSFPNIESEKAARLTVVSWHIIRRHCVRKNDLRFSRLFRVFYSRQDVPRTDGIAYVLRDRWFIVDRARNFTNTFERFFFFFFFCESKKNRNTNYCDICKRYTETIHGKDNRERDKKVWNWKVDFEIDICKTPYIVNSSRSDRSASITLISISY